MSVAADIKTYLANETGTQVTVRGKAGEAKLVVAKGL